MKISTVLSIKLKIHKHKHKTLKNEIKLSYNDVIRLYLKKVVIKLATIINGNVGIYKSEPYRNVNLWSAIAIKWLNAEHLTKLILTYHYLILKNS